MRGEKEDEAFLSQTHTHTKTHTHSLSPFHFRPPSPYILFLQPHTRLTLPPPFHCSYLLLLFSPSVHAFARFPLSMAPSAENSGEVSGNINDIRLRIACTGMISQHKCAKTRPIILQLEHLVSTTACNQSAVSRRKGRRVRSKK